MMDDLLGSPPEHGATRASTLFEQLLDAAPDATLGVDSSGRIVFVNDQAVRIFGYERGELLGRRIETLVPDDVTARHRGLRERYLAAPAHRAMGSGNPLYAKRKDGTVFPAEISLSGLRTDNGMIVSAAIRDIGDRIRMEQERAQLRQEADQAKLQEKLQRTQRIESLGQLAGGIAHDFNNLLGVILNYADFICEHTAGNPDRPAAPGLAEVHQDAQQIMRAARRGTDLTRQLLAFARQDVTRPQAVRVDDVLHSVEDMLRRSIGEHIMLVVRREPECRHVLIDPGQLEQVLVNLVVNARDAMPAGGTLTIDSARLVIDSDYLAYQPALKPGTYQRLRVSDTGTGMPRDIVDRVFEPFFTTKPTGQGTGLGLAMVYGIVTAAGGSVGIYSEEGLGTTINIMLPITDQRTGDAAAPGPAGHDLGGHGETVLLAEDEPALRQVCCRLLDSNGYHVLVADDCAGVLELCRSYAGSIDLLLTDVVMPQMLGTDLAERITGVHPETRVLFMSGYATPVLAAQGHLDPGIALLEKPFSRVELLTAVSHVLHSTG
ncbi:PAS domain S-box protein [Actinoplanes sp. HUAS TT8]|uniref:PAS domain S-box protein n=1 Tax=Actinoplanes sp. HUAS TT8 TaxID=3447453 RepID=UPI003F528D3E